MTEPFFTHVYAGEGFPVEDGVVLLKSEGIRGSFHVARIVPKDSVYAEYIGSWAIIEGEGGREWFVKDLEALERVV